MGNIKVAEWVPQFVEGELYCHICSNCGEEEGPDAPIKFNRCPNCNYRMYDDV